MRKRMALLFLALVGCTDADKTRSTLRQAGFTDVEVGGFAPFMCGDDYTFATKFRAKNPQGLAVDGAVCCGWMKGCSVKF